MANNFGDQDVRCPYFVRQEKTHILCEGLCQEPKQYAHVQFNSTGGKVKWMNTHCNTFDFRSCPYCQIMDAVYDENSKTTNMQRYQRDRNQRGEA